MSTAGNTFRILQCIKFINSFIQLFDRQKSVELHVQFDSIVLLEEELALIAEKCDYNFSLPRQKEVLLTDLLFTLPVILTGDYYFQP